MGADQNLDAAGQARLVDVGGYRLALRQAGRGEPTVVLEMGLGAAGDFVDEIARQVAEFTRVVWYDRAGLGRSDPAPTPAPRTVADLAADLHRLLHVAQIPAPYVLAGHSMGGLTARYYRQHHSSDIAALVLIESTHEEQRERLLAALPADVGDELLAVAQYRHALRVSWTDPKANAEQIDNLANSRLMRQCTRLDRLPLVVVSRGQAQAPAGLPPDLVARRERAWRELQCELAALSSRSVHLIAEHSGHLVNQDQPEMVVQGIRQALALVRVARDDTADAAR
jgi:pimeloyl-ACP methyl ester carboxylesterase